MQSMRAMQDEMRGSGMITAQLAAGMIAVRRVRGSLSGSSVDAAQRCKFGDFNTVAASDAYVKTGRVFFEARIDAAVGNVQLGWISDGFARSDEPSDEGVGDDRHSWAGDGLRQQRWHGGEGADSDARWAAGDGVGVGGAALLVAAGNGSSRRNSMPPGKLAAPGAACRCEGARVACAARAARQRSISSEWALTISAMAGAAARPIAESPITERGRDGT